MSANKPDPFAQSHLVALYQGLMNDRTRVAAFWGPEDATYRPDEVRISEPTAVSFKPLSTDEAIGNAVAALDAQEKKLLADTEMSLRQIRERKQSLMALSYQPTECERCEQFDEVHGPHCPNHPDHDPTR